MIAWRLLVPYEGIVMSQALVLTGENGSEGRGIECGESGDEECAQDADCSEGITGHLQVPSERRVPVPDLDLGRRWGMDGADYATLVIRRRSGSVEMEGR
jgi:uncharacterized ferredoxin-like protein